MAESLLDKISIYDGIITDKWANGSLGKIVDIEGDGNFRFVDYRIGEDGLVKKCHARKDDEMKCPIVATGIVGYWLHNTNLPFSEVLKNYYDHKLTEYVRVCQFDIDLCDHDNTRDFIANKHIAAEQEAIKSSEAIFPYLTDEDVKKIKTLTNKYLGYARKRRNDYYASQYPKGEVIEKSFVAFYEKRGAAHECMMWMRTEYNLPNMGPHCFHRPKMKTIFLTPESKERHDIFIPKYVSEQFEDFDMGVLLSSNGGLMEEIDANLTGCHTLEDKLRYIAALIIPFKEFSEAFNCRAQRESAEQSIALLEKRIKDMEALPDEAVNPKTGTPIMPKAMIASSLKDIESFRKDIEHWTHVQKDFNWFAQHGLGTRQDMAYPQPVNEQMCRCLGGWWKCMVYFAMRLASLSLAHGIKLMDVQEKCKVYLKAKFDITDYVDHKFISSVGHAQILLDEIDAKQSHQESPNRNQSTQTPPKKKKTNLPKATPSDKPMTLKYYQYDDTRIFEIQRERVVMVFKLLNQCKWISSDTPADDFEHFFKGKPRYCNIRWTGTNAELTFFLQRLLKEPYIQKQNGCSTRHLVEKQFGLVANYDKSRVDDNAEFIIDLALRILNPSDDLSDFKERHNNDDNDDLHESAIREVKGGWMRSKKGT